MQEQLNAVNDDPNYLKGLGGWLILVAIGITISPFLTAFQLYSIYQPLFEDGSFAMLTNPAYTMYIPHMKSLIYAEISINSIIILAAIYLIFLFYTKHHYFPKLYIALAVFYPIFLFVDSWAVNLLMPDIPIFDEETTKQIARSIIGAAIWVPYMLTSVRVKNTFINPQPSVGDEPLVTETLRN